jgi:hypothetical protein
MTADFDGTAENDSLTHLPPDFVKQHLNISQEVLGAMPPGNYAVLPS